MVTEGILLSFPHQTLLSFPHQIKLLHNPTALLNTWSAEALEKSFAKSSICIAVEEKDGMSSTVPKFVLTHHWAFASWQLVKHS